MKSICNICHKNYASKNLVSEYILYMSNSRSTDNVCNVSINREDVGSIFKYIPVSPTFDHIESIKIIII